MIQPLCAEIERDEPRELNEIGLDILLMDLQLATAFMDAADSSQIENRKRRNYESARSAYHASLRLLDRLTPDQEQLMTINARLACVEIRLQPAGGKLGTEPDESPASMRETSCETVPAHFIAQSIASDAEFTRGQ